MKRAIIILLILMGIYFLASFVFSLIKSSPDRSYIIKKGEAPLIIAHGGSKQLFPENTMMAFDGADQFHPDVMEMDVVLTKDNVLVTHHDSTIDRLSNGEGKVADYTYDELKQFNFGHKFKDTGGSYPYRDTIIPPAKLEEVLAKYGSKYQFCIEMKDYSPELGQRAARQLYELLKKYDMENRTLVACFEDDVLNYFHKISDGSIHISSGKKQTKQFVILDILHLGDFFTGKTSALQIPVERERFKLDKKSLIKTAHQKNIAVHYWTINDEEKMKELIDLGVDGIITDRPDLLKKVLKEKKVRQKL
ncbi:MAG: glycerophosphodiester phosphodiesterase [Dysgonamonadaceae bacterium]|jgi:glycerophosphoryl diester phosphodiesterase|nr:glycerophosphodiester phosphodiesterase [Dysgonamonadaceae bacterium]